MPSPARRARPAGSCIASSSRGPSRAATEARSRSTRLGAAAVWAAVFASCRALGGGTVSGGLRFTECALGDGVEGGDGNGVTATKCRGDAARDVGRVHAASGGSERVRGGAGYPREAEVVEVLRVEVVAEGAPWSSEPLGALEGRARAEHGLPGVRVGVPGGLGTVGGVLREATAPWATSSTSVGGRWPLSEGGPRAAARAQLQEDVRGGGFRLLHAT